MHIGENPPVPAYSSPAISQEGHTHENFFSIVIKSLPGIARRVTTVAIPIIVIAAMSTIPQASAGPLTYALCISACEAGLGMAGLTLAAPTGGLAAICTSVASYFACPSLCAPVLAAPSP